MATLLGPFCQSCGTPMEKPRDFGTDANGNRVNDYCKLCHQSGRFTRPDLSLDQMAELVMDGFARRMKVARYEAKDRAREFLSRLKRWSQSVSRAA